MSKEQVVQENQDQLSFLNEEIARFNEARGWNPMPADLAKSIVIEAAELLEHFQWDESARRSGRETPKDYDEIGEEVADIYWYLITLCKAAGIDLAKVVREKIEKNEEKYPEEQFKGKHNDEFYKSRKREYRRKRKSS
jgi:NTP pyrophosphatase (non-canonical NTP hydrolase)